MQQFWNERYSKPEMAYGREPNDFFAEQLRFLEPGRLLLPAEGEGRNAVYAAAKGWQVQAFDYSAAGRDKAHKLAKEAGVTINYELTDAGDFTCEPETFDAVALIYAHFPPELRSQVHARIIKCLKPGGTL
ncbi:MAG TPA: class I SAM-dependent methyltransferase, partial [Adhaeribacter sp.]|nr:class I SAM-dependent methyltransferase [Adhaeribacter sp.]